MASNRTDSDQSVPCLDREIEETICSSVEPHPLCTACWSVFEDDDALVCPDCGNRPKADGWARLPYTFLDRYVFLELVGRGGLGAVFRARHVDPTRAPDQTFAVKVVQMGARLERQELLAQMFEREISAAALLGRSRYFVRVLGHDTGKHLHLAMEYVPWPTLKQLLDHGTLSPQRVAQLGIAMLHPIEVMHAHNLVHRDLKPANIFVREEANNDYLVKLADLGLWILDEAHVKDGATDSLTTRNEFAGTLDYASPEQMMGSGIGARSDLHAVGSVLWCAYTGQVPFPACGEGPHAALRARSEAVLRMPECPSGMPLQLYSIITKALHPEPSGRFESAREFSIALQNFVAGPNSETSAVEGVGGSASAAKHGQKPPHSPDADLSAAPSSRQLATAGASRRSRRAAVAVAVGIAALVAGAAVAIVKRSRDPAVVVPVASRALPATAPRLTSGSAPAVSSTALPVESSPAPGVVQVVVGARHSCAVLREGTLRCWGANEAGQLGDGTTVPRSRGVQPTGLTDAVSVVLGDAHSCGLTRRGEVWCWGANASGQLGDGASSDRLSPTRIQTLKDVERVHAFACGAFARLRDGSVYGWGCNEGGQMGSNAAEDWLLPKQIPALHGAVALTSVGTSDEGATCAIRAGGVPHCWSWGLEQLRPRLPAFANLERVTDVVLGTGHGCLLLEAGTARCWGDNSSGEVGDGTLQSRAEAVAVPHVQELEQLVVGERHTCGRTRGGEVYCWGGNARGQLGHAAQANRPEPRLVPGVIGARQLLAAGDATCALLDSGRVTCWGDRGVPGSAARGPSVLGGAENIELLVGEPNRVLCMHARADGLLCMGDDEHGQLGRGRVAETSTPVQVAGLDAVERIAAAARNACAIRADGALHCWGSNAWRAFGNKDGKHTSPVQVDKGALDVTVGARGLYALVTGAGGKSKPRMGGALLRDLGAGRFDDIAYPRPVRGLDSVRQVAMGAYHACALLQDGNVACWGDNTYGQVGDGTAQHRTKPTRVPNFEGIVELATGGFHTCARRDNGTVACWGNNTDGQVGTGPGMRCRASGKSYSCVREPRRVVGVAKATSLAAGQWHTCVLRENGTAMCWGANAMGQLGDGTTISRAMPAPVLHLSAVRQLAAAEQHTCAALEDGSLRCWGTGARGELGAGPMSTCGQRHVPCAKAPIPVEGIRDAVQVAAGWEFSCALTRDKHVWCWGNNQRGTLGDGSVVRGDHPEPVTW